MQAYNLIKGILRITPKDLPVQLEKSISEDNLTKMTYPQYEEIVNQLFSTPYTDSIRIINSYYKKLVGNDTSRFFHLKVTEASPKCRCQDMINNYNTIFMFHTYIDCSDFLYLWSPTIPYYPLLTHIQDVKPPNKPINYTYWLRRFNEIPNALNFLKKNDIKLNFTDSEELAYVFKTIPERYVKSFLNILGKSDWYLPVIKETKHFTEIVEDWESKN